MCFFTQKIRELSALLGLARVKYHQRNDVMGFTALFQATPNGPACCWWLLAVLPIDPRYQLSVLSMTSLRERLVKIQHILTYLQSIPSN